MADTKKISQLTATSSIGSSDVLPIVQDGETKKITQANLMASYRTSSAQDAIDATKQNDMSLTIVDGAINITYEEE